LKLLEDGLIWKSLPDSRRVDVFLGENGAPLMRWSNWSVLPPSVLADLAEVADQYWCEGSHDVTSSFANRWIVNTCADIDEYQDSLMHLDAVLGTCCPIWNHPRAVALTRRDLAPQVFGDIEGLQVPHVLRFAATHTGIFRQIFAEGGFVYPVLVRPASSQTGIGLVKVSSAEDWARLEQTHNLGRHYFMTQFVDYRDATGRFVKVRLCFVDETVSLREYGASGGWQIGSGGSTGPSTETAIDRSITQLLQRMDRFQNWTALRRVCDEMVRRCPLNFWGVDLGVRADDSFVFFEANAAMTMAVASNVPPSQLPRMEPVYQNIAERLQASFARIRHGKAMPLPARSTADLLASNP
jgi:hypothetical protein